MTSLTNGDAKFFDFFAGVLQGDTLALHTFIICFNYVLRTSIDLIKENGFTRERQEADYIAQKL